jgi:AraC family L-rhamnose operon regulatory protein RhaS
MKLNIHEIQPYEVDGKVYHADTCLPLIDAANRDKIKFKALARYTYPGERLTSDTHGLNSIGYWDANEPQDWGLDWHRNEGIEIHFLESGKMPYAQGDQALELEPNHFTLTRPWEEHKVGDPHIGMGKFYWVIIDLNVRRPHQQWEWPDWVILNPKDLFRLTKIIRQNKKAVWKGNKQMRQCFSEIANAVETDIAGSNSSKIRLLINQLLLILLDVIDQDETELDEALTDSSHSVKLFLEELNSNLGEAWTIEKMAKSSGVGLTRFTHHCKQITNLTPMRYLMIKRIALAKKILLEQPNLTATEIAYICGFASSQYFSTVFKKSEKCSPNEFRISQLSTTINE